MSKVKITELPAADALDGSELVPLVQGGDTRAATSTQISAYASGTGHFLLVANNLSDVTDDATEFTNIGAAYTVATLAALKALTARPEAVIVETGQAKGVWQWELGSVTAADDGVVVECTSGTAGRYKRIHDGILFLEWWGGTGDNATDNHDAFEAMFAYVETLGAGDYGAATLQLLAGRYRTTEVETDVQGIRIAGANEFGSRIAGLNAAQSSVFHFTNTSGVFHFENVEVYGYPNLVVADWADNCLVFDGGTVHINNCRLYGADNPLWIKTTSKSRVNACQVGNFETAGIRLGGGSSTAAEIWLTDNRIYSGSGSTTPSATNRGVQILLDSRCAHVEIYGNDGGSTEKAVHIVDSLAVGSAASSVFMLGCNAGQNSVAGLHIEDGGGDFQASFCRFSAPDSNDGDGVLIESTTANPIFKNCDWHQCRRDGIRVTDALHVTVLGGNFNTVGRTGVNGTGIHAVSGSTIYTIAGPIFDNSLQGTSTLVMDYAWHAETAWTGSAEISGCTTRSITTPFVNDSSSGGTMNIANPRVVDVSASDAALRVTQRGSGNALEVEDSTSVDATPGLIVSPSGVVISGYGSAITYADSVTPRIQAVGTTASASSVGASNWATTDNAAGSFYMARSRGNTLGTHTAVISGNTLGTLGWSGSDGTNFIPAASIRAEVDGTPATTDMPGRIIFATTLDGAATVTDRWQIGNTGMLRMLSGSFSRGVPVTKSADFTVATSENWLINNKAGSTCTVTLPAAATFPGREIMITNYQAQTVVSASSNVVPIAGGAASTAILSGTAGRWAQLVSDGTNWIILQGVI
jgi:hypothetical protein